MYLRGYFFWEFNIACYCLKSPSGSDYIGIVAIFRNLYDPLLRLPSFLFPIIIAIHYYTRSWWLCPISLQMKALKGLGLDVTKGTVITGDSVKQTEFFITRSWVILSLIIWMCISYFLDKSVFLPIRKEKLGVTLAVFVNICSYCLLYMLLQTPASF